MTPAEIAEIAARWAKAQRGPWRVVLVPNIGESMIVDADGGCVDGFHMSEGTEAAIAHAPQDVAALLGEIARLDAELTEYRSEHHRATEEASALRAEVEKMRPAWEAVEHLRLARAAHVAADDAWIAAGRPPMLLRDGDLAEHPTVVSFYETLTAREDARAKLIALTSADDERGRV